MEINKTNTLGLLKALAIVKVLMLAVAFYTEWTLLFKLGGLWLLSGLSSEMHLIDFCKNGKLVRFGGTVDYIDPENTKEVKASYYYHIGVVIAAFVVMAILLFTSFI